MSTVTELTDFESILVANRNYVGTSLLLVLCWIAASDGDISDSELRNLQEIAEASGHQTDARQIIQIACRGDLDAIHLACEILRERFENEDASMFLQLAVGMAISDGRLTAGENYILRFLGDLLDAVDTLDQAFHDVSGRSIPPLSDPSSRDFWESEAGSGSKSKQETGSDQRNWETPKESARSDFRRVSALALLGLVEPVTKEEVKTAYRRLAQIHHPDRFVRLGDEAVAAASARFRDIKAAYDYLYVNA